MNPIPVAFNSTGGMDAAKTDMNGFGGVLIRL